MRLAERKGLLLGTRLSAVQEMAVEMLLLLAERRRIERRASDLEDRLVAAHPHLADLHPWAQGRAADRTSGRTVLAPDEDTPDHQVAWSVPTPAEADDLDAYINRALSQRGAVGAAELEGEGWL